MKQRFKPFCLVINMSYIAVTLSSKYLRHSRDVLLPADVPHYTLSEAVATSLGIPVPSLHRPILSADINGSKKNLPVQASLQDLGIKTGTFLFLDFEEIRAPAYLICMKGPHFDLEKDEVIMGCSSTVDIDLRSIPLQEYVSRRHARIYRQKNEYYFEDVGSKNGSFLNGKKIEHNKGYPIFDGDHFLLGPLESTGIQFVFRIRK